QFAEDLLNVTVPHVLMGLRGARRRQLAREARQIADMVRVAVREGAELVAIQELVGATRTLQQHHLHPTIDDRLLQQRQHRAVRREDRKSTRLNYSHVKISYAVFC